jgi:hypothetical protein
MLNDSSGTLLKDVNVIIVNKKENAMDESPSIPSNKNMKSLKVKGDDDVSEEEIVCKIFIRCDDEEDSNEEKKVSLKRKRVDGNYVVKREYINFGPTANPSLKSRKTYSSKVPVKPVKGILSKSKLLAKNLVNSITKSPNSLPLGIAEISNAYTELIEGDYFADNEANKTIVTYVLDVIKCLDGYMSSQIYKEVIKIPGWSILIAILCSIVFTIIINSYWTMLISMFRYLRKILSETVDIAKGV